MHVHAIKVDLRPQALRALGERLAKGYAAGTTTVEEVAQNGRFSYIMPQLQAALKSRKPETIEKVTRDTITASHITHSHKIPFNNRAWQFLSSAILPMAERRPKLAEYILKATKKGANQHDAHSLYLRMEVLERLGNTKAQLKELWAYSQELFAYEDQKKAGKGFTQLSKDKIPQSVKAKIFKHDQSSTFVTNKYLLKSSQAWSAINERMKKAA